jgi:D-alanyl-D-alanine carboxypeptidase
MSPYTLQPESRPTQATRNGRRRAWPVIGWLVVLVSFGIAAALALSWLPSASPVGGSFAPPANAAGFGADDGVIPDFEPAGVDSDLPAITQLDPDLLAALREANEAAAADGQVFEVTSGWRSTRYQESLFDDAVQTYGSEEAAREFVASPTHSRHVTGDAVDIGPLDAQLWLMEHGYEYGLCQTYANERWHFELATTPGEMCPDMRANASEDWS